MAEIIERELKLLIPDEVTWALIRAHLVDTRPSLGAVTQTNTYFDTRDRRLLRAATGMVRIREEDGAFEVTCKDKVLSDDGELVTRERTDPLEPADALDALNQRKALTDIEVELCISLLQEQRDALYPIGALVNHRHRFELGDGYVLELDRTELPGQTEYEIEIELTEGHHSFAGARAALGAVLPEALVEPLSPSRSKYRRFLAALGR